MAAHSVSPTDHMIKLLKDANATVIFMKIMVIAVHAQLDARHVHPQLYAPNVQRIMLDSFKVVNAHV